MKTLYILSLLLVINFYSIGQELNCQIQVASQQVQTTEKKVFQTLQTALYEFMNQTKFTKYSYKMEERIECSILINVTDWNLSDQFKATIHVQSRRPVYKTSYNTVMLNFLDKDFDFTYVESEPIDFQLTVFSSNLTAVLAYYANIIIGLDFDSYQLYGGQQYFENAQTIVNTAQSAKESGWKAFENQKNRFWLVENLLNSSYKGLREASYKYHRLGLDVMSEKMESGRATIIESMELLKKVNREKPNLFALQQVIVAKGEEIINIFSEASPVDKPKAVAIMKEIDPANSSKYQKIISN